MSSRRQRKAFEALVDQMVVGLLAGRRSILANLDFRPYGEFFAKPQKVVALVDRLVRQRSGGVLCVMEVDSQFAWGYMTGHPIHLYLTDTGKGVWRLPRYYFAFGPQRGVKWDI